MSAGNRSTLWAAALADELGRHGIRHVGLGSGSRSAPLVLALSRDDRFTLHPHLDERSAAFFALGVARATGEPAVVLTTSGTAAANLLPAAIEAAQGESPLLLVTADRPAGLRGLDANQTIDQVGLFGRYTRGFADIPITEVTDSALRGLRSLVARLVAASAGPPPGPVHLNVQFDKPLTPVGDEPPGPAGDASFASSGRAGDRPYTRLFHGPSVPAAGVDRLSEALSRSRRTLIVCGPTSDRRAGPAALRLAAEAGVPLLPDPLSGARFTPGATGPSVPHYDLILSSESLRQALRPELIVRVGAGPTSADAQRLLDEAREAEQIVIDAGGRWKDHSASATDYLIGDPAAIATAAAARVASQEGEERAAEHAEAWRAAWRSAGERARAVVADALAGELFEGAIAATVSAAVPAGATFFVGNSMPIRDVDAFAHPRDDEVRAIGFRGASGIDGNVSGAAGAAAATGGSTVALLGDLTFLHDRNGLLTARREALPLVLVVVQNEGGGIFHMLPVRDHDPPFTEHIVMPHGVQLNRVARAAGIEHCRVTTSGDLSDVLAEGIRAGAPLVIEVPVDRGSNWERRHAVVQAVRDAVSADVRPRPRE